MFEAIRRIKKIFCEKAQGMVEYALIIAMVVAVCVVALTDNPIFEAIHGIFNQTETHLDTAKENMNSSGGE